MPRVITNISSSHRQASSTFSEQIPSTTIGPASSDIQSNVNGDAIASSDIAASSTLVNWQVMNRFTDDLKKALTDWIDTTKEGTKAPHDNVLGREKTMIYDFYGNATKSVMPGEIGQFKVVFAYPPTVTSSNPPTVPNVITPPVVSNNQQS
jgi:hypothetical protein